MKALILAIGAAALLAACATRETVTDLSLARAMAGESQTSGAALDRRVAAAAAHPLGTMNNPVRAHMPDGQRAYLRRLRCGNGRAPTFHRVGNFGLGVYRNIIDGYKVNCGDASPGEVDVYMDMYHPRHVEDRPVPGFTIVPSS